MNDFVDRVKSIMHEKHITQRELAKRIGVTEVSVSRYLTGQRIPKVTMIAKIADALSVSPAYLLGCEEHKQTNADRIRNMSDEKLAEFISQIVTDCYDSISFGSKEYAEVWDDKKTALEWLQKEVEE